MVEMNYYEWLGVPATSDTDEIVQVIDDRYIALRAIATHPDPAKVRQAEIDRELVERARAILTDPTLRQAYDLSLAGATAGGLADPTAIPTPQAAPPPVQPPPRPKASPLPADTAGEVGGQVCPKCGTANDAGSKHCLKCGTALLKSCPNCQHSVPQQAIHCPNCGVNIADFVRQQAEAEQHQLESARRQVEIETELGTLQQGAKSASKWVWAGYPFGVLWLLVVMYFLTSYAYYLILFGGYPFWLVGLRKALNVLDAARVPGDEAARHKANNARIASIIGLTIPVIFYIIMFLIN